MSKAAWVLEYDHINDKCYRMPGCDECGAPVGLDEDGQYRCFSCGQAVESDDDMKKWFEVRDGEKVEMTKCLVCGEEQCETHYFKNNVTLEWQTAFGECRKCGAKFIV